VGCEEGAEEMVRDVFGYIVFGIGLFVLMLAIGLSCFRKHQKERWDTQVELLGRQVDSIRIQKRRKEKQAQLDRLKPKLDIIAKRLCKIEEGEIDSSSRRGADADEPKAATSSASKTAFSVLLRTSNQEMIQLDGDTVRFDARRIYHCLDTDKDGDLSFEELNAILGLADLELQNFVSRMQELGGMDDESTHVSRPLFERYFLQVLEENSHLNVTQEEAAATYDDILLENGSEKLREKMLYNSSTISRILTEQQIYTLIKVRETIVKCVVGSSHVSVISTC
jgi:hypothetical protein